MSFLNKPPDIDKLREARNRPKLEKAAGHRDPTVRARASDALAALTDEDWAALLTCKDDVLALVRVVNDPLRDTSARSAAVLLLARVPNSSVINTLAAVIEQSPGMIAGMATLGLWRVGTSAASERLVGSVEDSTVAEDRKFLAAHALGMIGSSAEQALVKVVQSNGPDSDAFAFGILALAASGSSEAASALAKSTDKGGFVEQLRGLLASPPESLIAGLSHSHPSVRTLSATALGNRKEHSAIPALIKAAHDAHEEVSGQAIVALGKVGGTQAVETIVTRLKSTDTGLKATDIARRVIATLALGLIENDPTATRAIKERLLDTALVVRAAALLAEKE